MAAGDSWHTVLRRLSERDLRQKRAKARVVLASGPSEPLAAFFPGASEAQLLWMVPYNGDLPSTRTQRRGSE